MTEDLLISVGYYIKHYIENSRLSNTKPPVMNSVAPEGLTAPAPLWLLLCYL
jgi:hypothetical protein